MLQDKALKGARTAKYDTTKTGKSRISLLAESIYSDRIKAWIELSLVEKEKIRDVSFSYILRKAALLSFPNDPDSVRMKPHDFRHSYAANMLNRGLNISQIAKLLGNGVNVCEKYYLPYSLTEEAFESIENTITKNKKDRSESA